MVLLTMTPSIVEAVALFEAPVPRQTDDSDDGTGSTQPNTTEPSLESPAVGNPIAHGQIVDLWKKAKSGGESSHSLEELLRGAVVYIPPPPAKKEPTPEYKALMARLRRAEEARSYERMVNPLPNPETFQDRFPTAAYAFAEVNRPSRPEDVDDDEITYNDVHRQVTLIINFLVSIAGVAGTLWIAARWWSTPSRLFLTLGGSILVAIAEVVVYNGYMWRMGQAKKKQEGVKEVKQVIETWVVNQDKGMDEKTVLIKEKEDETPDTMRKRKREVKVET
ncbi:endoplasmic reticulum-based factor for assembly of V-ATPase-domain-containing protein [Thelonectria olida]|uniref:Endoplasmic reticulum-based factor for assembly of V-ATPase-domain-containing protein n=1 Tax=Thelonectria olida TaxID=1576542 RepID=A0A9P9AWW9_9HYPO|nr:endoplasmic reticulum-based factor for assembly of V-ATPase-domain-containing protein [Thelonectria olida]